jgi:YesN/AraC family two-component response regulator
MTILITDDHAVIRNLLKFYLKENKDIEIKEASNGVKALQICSAVSVDVLMLDITMPELDGFNVANYLKAHSSQTVIVAISSNLDDENKKVFESLGVKYFLQKPINKKILLETIDKIKQEIDG